MTGIPPPTSYPDCNIGRKAPALVIDKDIAEALGKDFRVLPLFEKGLFEYKYRKYYSLHTNELLKCRWRSYVQHFDEREFTPFEFINIRDYHFYNSVNRLIPSESFYKKTEFRYKLKVGPGVDYAGQMPIPQDLLMKRGVQKPRAKAKRYSNPKNDNQTEIKDEKVKI